MPSARRVAGAAILLLLAAAATLLATSAFGRMRSLEVDRHLCKTVHGGKFVDIPGFPGERIDRRLLADVRWLVREYEIFVTDGYALSGHSPNGEHPIGLALDIVPDKAAGGSWRQVDKLAEWAEPRPDDPRPPFRWVGYDGDAGHGRGHHLHLSWMHTETKPGDPARVVYTRRCPKKDADNDSPGDEPGGGTGETPGDLPPVDPDPPLGGGGVEIGTNYTGDGGVESKGMTPIPVRAATGGVDAKRRLESQIARLQATGPQHD
jgi:hypothetical protein